MCRRIAHLAGDAANVARLRRDRLLALRPPERARTAELARRGERQDGASQLRQDAQFCKSMTRAHE
jgi:hypothetical protein